MKKDKLTVIWSGTLDFLMAKLKRKPYEVTRIKRLGIYYMCIDDLPR